MDASNARPPSKSLAALHVIAAALVLVCLRALRLPGADDVEEAAGFGHALFPDHSLGVVLGMQTFVLAQLVAKTTKRDRHPWPFVGYAVFHAIQSLFITLSFGQLVERGDTTPAQHAFRFAMLVTAGLVLWLVAAWVERMATWVSGAWFVVAVLEAVDFVRSSFEAGSTHGEGMRASTDDFAPLVLGAAIALAFAAGRSREASAWPLPLVSRLSARSAIDVALLPIAALSLANDRWLGTALPGVLGSGELIRPTVALVVACSVAAATLVRAPRVPSMLAAGMRASAGLLAIAALSSSPWLVGYARARDTPEGRAAFPMRGDSAYDVVLVDDGGTGEADAPRLEARLRALGADVEVVSRGANEIHLRLENAVSRAVLERALAVHSIDIHALAPLPEGPMPPSIQLVGWSGDDATRWEGTDCDELRQHSENIMSTLCTTYVSERAGPHGSTCFADCLVPEAEIRTSDVRSTSLEREGEFGWFLSIRLTDGGKARFAGFTGAHVGRRIAIVLDGSVESTPVVAQPITGGNLSLSPNVPRPTVANLRILQISLDPRYRVRGHWRIVEGR